MAATATCVWLVGFTSNDVWARVFLLGRILQLQCMIHYPLQLHLSCILNSASIHVSMFITYSIASSPHTHIYKWYLVPIHFPPKIQRFRFSRLIGHHSSIYNRFFVYVCNTMSNTKVKLFQNCAFHDTVVLMQSKSLL